MLTMRSFHLRFLRGRAIIEQSLFNYDCTCFKNHSTAKMNRHRWSRWCNRNSCISANKRDNRFLFFVFSKSRYLAKYWRYRIFDCTIVISDADWLHMQSFSRFNVVWKFNEKNRGTKNFIFFKLMWNRLKLCMHNESAPRITMVQSKFLYLR